jgi:predicted amidohydrolase YtcJ
VKKFLQFAFAVLFVASHVNAAMAPAELVIRNARIITVDQKFSIAQAIAISGDKIVAVDDNRRIGKFIGKETRVIDAKGKTVMPGLYDSHVHSYKASVSTLNGGAPYITSIAEAQKWIREQAAKKPTGSWIVLERVYATRMKEMRLPTKAELDEAAPNHPVLWNSGPVAIVNSKGLEVSHITRDTPNPTPGEIVKDAKTGEPTGVLRNAASLLKNPTNNRQPTPEEQREAVKHLHHLYNEQGITSIGERRTETAAIDLFRDLEKTGELTVRVNCTRLLDPVPKNFDDAVKKLDEMTKTNGRVYGPTGVGDDWVRIGPFKVFMDGGMLIGTAYMREPWGVTDIYQISDPNYRGQLFIKPEILNPFYAEAARRGWQLTAHCVGDAAMDVLLDCYQDIDKQMKIEKRRFLVTHANFVDEKNFDRCARLGVIADVQPAWLYKDADALKKVLGERRMENFFPLKKWFNHHIIVGGGSDHMVQLDSIESTNPWNPWLGMWVALTRHTERGSVDKPEQCLTREEAVRFYTINNCYLNFEEKKKGSLEPGKYADLIMIDRDILHCPVDDVRGTKILMTMVGGKVVAGSL